ncbi:uncharacterized protein KY384_006534 [Bacidia gigantensis]|uniref:uncharacterized protein n=1 Tax=Bacidia gigantensis TaxID=2732470 RepID=UPI001D04A665|nr:uncharacterized protein KY384_006534 [Bacidia gigantensis]KAG8528845.1 hypothetical protein KY384_006534 [Bacidia gigantensis]
MRQTESSTVPKFASFRPKATNNLPHDGKPSSSLDHVEEPVLSSASSKRYWELEKIRLGDVSRKIDLRQSSENHRALTNNDYIVDKVGDPNNVTFGSIDGRKVPIYTRSGRGALLGLSPLFRIDRSRSNEKKVVLSSAEERRIESGQVLVSRTLSSFKVKEQEIIPQASNTFGDSPQADFVFLDDAKSSKRIRGPASPDEASSCSEEENGSLDAETKSGHGQSNYRLDLREQDPTVVQSDRLHFSRRIDANSHDLDAWFALISCQENVLGKQDSRGSRTAAEKQSTSDIRISIYEKALQHIKESSGREALLIGMMKEGEYAWTVAELSAKWGSVLRDHPAYLNLWLYYLDFKQSAFVDFNYEALSNIYLQSLQCLREARSKVQVDSDEHSRLCLIQIHLILRFSLFLRDMGLSELALAVWQAILEFNLLRNRWAREQDPSLGIDVESTIKQEFATFWDSEVARIGELGSSRAGLESGMHAEGSRDRCKTDDVPSDANTFTFWAAVERQRASVSRQIARTTDVTEENDPYRVVLFSDIEPFLFSLPDLSLWHELVDAFLAFCHLQTPRSTSTKIGKAWSTNGFLRNETLYKPQHKVKQVFNTSVAFYSLEQHTMYCSPDKWFSPFSMYHSKDLSVPVDSAVISRTLDSLVQASVGGDDLSSYYLAFELSSSPGAARKKAKYLLKKRPSSLQLYNAFALLEYGQNNSAAAEKVIVTALKMTSQVEGKDQHAFVLLWRTWIWAFIQAQEYREASCRLMYFTNESRLEQTLQAGASSQHLSKQAVSNIREKLCLTRDHLISQSLFIFAAATAELLILLEFLEDPSTLDSASLAFSTNLKHFDNSAPNNNIQEVIHQGFARLLYHHVTHTTLFKPAEIRSRLADSIRAFPQNTIFLSLYAWNEARFSIDDRVRSIVRQTLHDSDTDDTSKDSVVPHFFAIDAELSRGITLGSNANATRGTFERALETRACAHCAGMWKMYFTFEQSRGEIRRAKSVFYRAIRACPWVKELYMLAFEWLNEVKDGMNEEELRGVYDLMEEKGIRVHVDLEELIERRERDSKKT